MPSPFRRETNAILRQQTYRGRILDLGGSKYSEYASFLRRAGGEITVVNIDTGASPDIVADLEQPLPVADASYDTVLAINVLEHVYHHRALLDEIARMLAPGGVFIAIVPFCIQIHPSPDDFFRYTASALRHLLEDAGFASIEIQPLGSGVMVACAQLLYNFFPGWLGSWVGSIAALGDRLLRRVTRSLGKSYDPSHYPLGYIIRAHR